MKLRFTANDQVATATLVDGKAAKDLLTLLPLTLTLLDGGHGERTARLPRSLENGGKWIHSYRTGFVVYRPAASDLTIYHGTGGGELAQPGILLGYIGSGLPALDKPGRLTVTFEPYDEPE
jgi:hypothetical protein